MVKLQEMEFAEDEALVAADNCDDVYAATKFLRQECELCANVMNVTEVTYLREGKREEREQEREREREIKGDRLRPYLTETEMQKERERERRPSI